MYPCRVLFICTGNSARSILSEAMLNHRGSGRFEAFSAGSRPTGRVNRRAIEALQSLGIATDGLSSKSWDRYTGDDAPALDIVITVCDNAANEVCPVLFGDFVKSHWGMPDPATARGVDALAAAFREARMLIDHRLTTLLALPLEAMGRDALRKALDHIGALTVEEGRP